MKTTFALISLFFSISIWSQTSSGSGTGGTGTGGGIKVTISSNVYSNTLEILPTLTNAKVIGYKIYDSNLELIKDTTIQPTNNETIAVEDLSKGKYYVQLFLDKEEDLKLMISKQFIKE